ncbi:hypothetical protein GCM10020358_78230 [Amorphoplanes nipponensis]|uniref:Uncharacterized protein n=1 Tax=Actinoplanes nipponensis TaxID=135950 RepID=A0A919JLI5_9ACTN|nr:hypothetical protein [Actinoplanes nipponensis]GIE52766.1 hypothetical protein Ani05nite_63000 [Actinoplanes nipponensis]
MNVIDLDRPAVVPPARSRRSHLLVAAALVVGAVLGACATYGWAVRREAAVRDRPVAVFVFAEASPFVDGSPADSVVRGGRVTTVTLTRRVTLVNAGPMPITIRDLSGSRPGVSVHGVDERRWIAPGETVQAEADVRVDCVHGLPLGRLPVTLSVQTFGQRDRETRPREGFDGTPWSEQAEVACAA